MVDEASKESLPRRLGRYDVLSVLAKPRSAAGSTLVIGTARSTPTSADGGGESLALSFSPLSPNEATTTHQRPVAIKLVSPAIAGDASLAARVLESARAMTEVRHANVAVIHEVGHIGGDLFLVMDYLLGETCATLMRQLHSRGETLDFVLAAHIIAEASAGLEAAHARGILHEGLTPHDLFIGYDGTVHVLDIGIAAACRRTSAMGGAGLEIEYASPERCKNETMDRRSDVFSLGTMLWELITGLSPFERAKEADTIRAICDETIVPPGNVLPGLPEQMSTITMQALARDRGARYQTAQALRQALLGFVRVYGMGASPTDHLRQVMERLFADRARDKREMLRRIDTGAPLTGLDVGHSDAQRAMVRRPEAPLANLKPPPAKPAPLRASKPKSSSGMTASETAASTGIVSPATSYPPTEKDEPSIIVAPTARAPLPVGTLVPSAPPPPTASLGTLVPSAPPAPTDNDEPSRSHVPTAAVTPEAASHSRTRRAAFAAAALLLIGGTGFALFLREAPDAARKRVPTTSPLPAFPSSDPTAGPGPGVAPLASLSAAPSSASIAIAAPSASESPTSNANGGGPTAPASSVDTIDATVVHIDTVPARATIFVAGAKRGLSPLDLQLPKGSVPVMIELRHPGYVTLKERVIPDVNQRLKLTLAAARGPAAPGSAPYHKFE